MKKDRRGIIFNTDDVFVFGEDWLAFIKDCARNSEAKSARLCLHKTIEDPLHQMIIVHCRGVYVRPHRHPAKTESFHLIQGSLLLCNFDDNGVLEKKVVLGEKPESEFLIARIEKNIYHTVIPLSDMVVFQEITNGPFTGTGDSDFPAWAPEPDNIEGINEFWRRMESHSQPVTSKADEV